jgi:hypothetical protein
MFAQHRRQAQVTIRYVTTRVLWATLLCAVGATQASAQTAVSQQLLELDNYERNAAFTLMPMDSGRPLSSHIAENVKYCEVGLPGYVLVTRRSLEGSKRGRTQFNSDRVGLRLL